MTQGLPVYLCELFVHVIIYWGHTIKRGKGSTGGGAQRVAAATCGGELVPLRVVCHNKHILGSSYSIKLEPWLI